MDAVITSLIKRCKNNDEEDFNQLLSQYEGYLYRICCSDHTPGTSIHKLPITARFGSGFPGSGNIHWFSDWTDQQQYD